MKRGSMALVAAALVAHAVVVHAAPLDKEECAKLKGEQVLLEQGGVRASMGRGPEWAKANLAPDKLEQVRRIIEIDEQLLFRCQGRPLVNFKEAPDPDPAAAGGSKEAAKAPVARAVKKPVKKVAVQPAAGALKAVPKAPAAAKKVPAAVTPAPANTSPANALPTGQAGEAAPKAADQAKDAKPKPKPKPKRKASEANSSGDWFTNPFADMLAPAQK